MPKGYRKDGTKLGFQKGHHFNKGCIGFWKGKTISKSIRKKMSLAKKGITPKNIIEKTLYSADRNDKISISRKNKSWEEIYGKEQAEKLKLKMSVRLKGKEQTVIQRRKKSLSQRGEKGSNWQGGKTKEMKLLSNNLEWKLWRKAVFERDNYTCQGCLVKGGYLEPHHIKPKSKYPKLIFEISNGITYCLNCHSKYDEQRNKFTKKI